MVAEKFENCEPGGVQSFGMYVGTSMCAFVCNVVYCIYFRFGFWLLINSIPLLSLQVHICRYRAEYSMLHIYIYMYIKKYIYIYYIYIS